MTTITHAGPTPGNTSPRARAGRLMELAASRVTTEDVQRWSTFDSAVIQKAWDIVDPTVDIATRQPGLGEEGLELFDRTPLAGTVLAVEDIAKYSDPANFGYILVVAELAKVRLSGNKTHYEVQTYTRRGVSTFVTENLSKADGMGWMAKALLHTRVLLFAEVQASSDGAAAKRIIRRIKPLGDGAITPQLRARTGVRHVQ